MLGLGSSQLLLPSYWVPFGDCWCSFPQAILNRSHPGLHPSQGAKAELDPHTKDYSGGSNFDEPQKDPSHSCLRVKGRKLLWFSECWILAKCWEGAGLKKWVNRRLLTFSATKYKVVLGDLQPPELRENKYLLFKPPSLWYSTVIAPANWCPKGKDGWRYHKQMAFSSDGQCRWKYEEGTGAG